MEKLKTMMVLLLISLCVVSCKEPEPEPEPELPVVPIEKTYEIGSYYEEGGVKGIVYKITSSDKKHGMIVAMDEESHAWAVTGHSENRTGAQSQTDGKANTDTIKEKFTITNYPAFAYCNDKNKGGVTGWYLPASQELIELRAVYVQVQDSLTAHGGTAFASGVYWSSSELPNFTPPYLTAYGVIMGGSVSTPSKTEIHIVRAVRAF